MAFQKGDPNINRHGRPQAKDLVNPKSLTGTEYREKEMKKYKEIYKRMMNEPKDHGIGLEILKLKFKLGQTYIVNQRREKGGSLPESFKGTMICETKDYIVLEGKYTRAFLKKDFLLGEYEIKEVRN